MSGLVGDLREMVIDGTDERWIDVYNEIHP